MNLIRGKWDKKIIIFVKYYEEFFVLIILGQTIAEQTAVFRE